MSKVISSDNAIPVPARTPRGLEDANRGFFAELCKAREGTQGVGSGEPQESDGVNAGPRDPACRCGSGDPSQDENEDEEVPRPVNIFSPLFMPTLPTQMPRGVGSFSGGSGQDPADDNCDIVSDRLESVTGGALCGGATTDEDRAFFDLADDPAGGKLYVIRAGDPGRITGGASMHDFTGRRSTGRANSGMPNETISGDMPSTSARVREPTRRQVLGDPVARPPATSKGNADEIGSEARSAHTFDEAFALSTDIPTVNLLGTNVAQAFASALSLDPAAVAAPVVAGRIAFQASPLSRQPEIRVAIHPAELGPVTVRLTTVKDGLRVEIDALAEGAREILGEETGAIAAALGLQGLSVADVVLAGRDATLGARSSGEGGGTNAFHHSRQHFGRSGSGDMRNPSTGPSAPDSSHTGTRVRPNIYI